MSLKCIVCSKNMELATLPNTRRGLVPVLDGVVCYTSGSFGSNVFEELNIGKYTRKLLQFVICDDCLKKNADNIFFVKEVTTKSVVDYMTLEDYCAREQQNLKDMYSKLVFKSTEKRNKDENT